ncbi:MAG TPA: hydroxymethylglutaryl-CoA lyase [Polyangiaceae bacterium]
MSGLFSSLPRRVSVYEVSPRDGLQNEKAIVPLDKKIELVDALVGAGLRKIEATSFVAKDWIAQLADADELVPRIAEHEKKGVSFSALVPNMRGFERAKSAGMKEIAFFMSASETHNQKNTNKSIERSLETFAELAPAAKSAGMRVRAYLSTVWGCPYEGAVDPERALVIGKRLFEIGADTLSLGDTIGVGTPAQTDAIVKLFRGALPIEKLALHMHDTRGTALPNILVGLENGITEFDASVGGLGGCPYAPGAAGNVATEDLVYMLHGMGIETGIDLHALVAVALKAEQIVGRPLPGKVHLAGEDFVVSKNRTATSAQT